MWYQRSRCPLGRAMAGDFASGSEIERPCPLGHFETLGLCYVGETYSRTAESHDQAVVQSPRHFDGESERSRELDGRTVSKVDNASGTAIRRIRAGLALLRAERLGNSGPPLE